ncbi:hypothetical protein [Enterovibrio norvegicus]|uniref:Uncharacterized protein n=1 Tax=Enterovibrio norvegicus TaxID=188144 RepID=A0A2N7LA67_9GAMM|nr:hypothetical protein [Enterovibrio norvegicus]PMN73698.1 hypothetical protein BCT27_01440 [Enterovibrio norvegicus]PMN91327.1 hypothetical protein BCT23_17605 [Enterovibrio norvegicus]
MAVEQSFVETLNAVWATPYGVAAQYIFIGGVVLQLGVMVSRYKMSVVDALLAVMGFKRVQHREKWFNILHVCVIAIPLGLLALAM